MSDKYCVLQDDLKDCGVCCLLSIIKYFDGNISKEYLRELTKTSKNGVSALNLLKCAREIGFEAYGLKGKLKNIKMEFLPVIAHVIIDKKYPHFVVIYKIDIKKNKILVMDPAKGYIFYSFSSFLNISTNYYLVLKPKHVIPKLVDKNNYVSKIILFLKEYKEVFMTLILLSLFYTIFNIIASYHFKLLYEENGNSIFLLLLLFILVKCLISKFRNSLINSLNIILDKYLIKDAFYHIINLPYLYYNNHTNGDLLTRINDLGNIKELINDLFISVFVDLFLAIIVYFIMIKINVKLTFIITVTLIIYAVIVFLDNNVMKKVIRENREKSSEINNYLVEGLASFETIKNLSIQDYICEKFNQKYDEYSEVIRKIICKINNKNYLKSNVLLIGNLIVIYVGIKLLNDNVISTTTLISYISLSNYLIEPIKNFLDLNIKYQNTKESINRIKEIYNIPTENLLFNKKSIKYLNGNISINNLSYSYNGVDNVLKNISFEIKEGEKILIYGNSGCGKSTIMQLLIKYLDNNYKGDITIGGYDLKNLDLFTLRKNICYISQNEFLYTDSVYENITLGRKLDYSHFLELADKLFINEIINKTTLGYNMMIEGNGENISGGERERIIIARSIIERKNIFIYDESFSEIDIKKERDILKYIFQLYPNKTCIIVSHRLSNEDLFSKKIKIGGDVIEYNE